jgi:hypothetical protein
VSAADDAAGLGDNDRAYRYLIASCCLAPFGEGTAHIIVVVKFD